MNVPLFEPRSSSVQPSPCFHSRACCRDTRMSGTKIWQSRAPPDDVLAVAELVAAARDRSGEEDQRRHLGPLIAQLLRRRISFRLALCHRDSQSQGCPERGWCTSPVQALGNFIGGAFVAPSGNGARVAQPGGGWRGRVRDRVHGRARSPMPRRPPRAAQPAWARCRSPSARAHLERFKAADRRARRRARRRDRARDRQDPERGEAGDPDAAQPLRPREGRDGRGSQAGAGRARRAPALPGARRRRRDRAVQLPAAPVSRARRARRCSPATPSWSSRATSRRCAASATPRPRTPRSSRPA